MVAFENSLSSTKHNGASQDMHVTYVLFFFPLLAQQTNNFLVCWNSDRWLPLQLEELDCTFFLFDRDEETANVDLDVTE